MPYLIGRAENRFEGRMNTFREGNSPQLTSTIKAVKTYLVEPTAARIRDVKFCWVAWKVQKPDEFGRKGEEIRTVFEAEMLTEYRMRGIKVDPDPLPPPQLILPEPPNAVINGWRYNAILGGKLGMAGASVGVSATGTAIGQGLGTAATGLVLGTGVAISATGVGLIAASVALTVGTSILSARAAWKSADHRDALMQIYEQRDEPEFSNDANCQVARRSGSPKPREAYIQHDLIANHVLPYVIYQKDRKFKHRAVGAIPIIGSIESVRGIGNYLYKRAKGTQGNLRRHAACWLAAHLVSFDCALVQAIVKEIYSGPEMEWLKGQEYKTAIEHIERKLKST
jgi:hypothetical protein